MSGNIPLASASLPTLLSALRKHVSEDMAQDDAAARELMEALDFAWIAAERWRLEQYDVQFHERAERGDAFSS